MNSMLKITSVIFSILLLLSGCVSQNNIKTAENFDQLEASKNRVSLGLTYLKNGSYSQAKFNLDKALEFAPRSADANFAMAYYYQSVGELEKAEKTYQFAMDLAPNNANIANSYGAFLCQNGNYEKAKKYFLKAVNTNSYISSAETYENLALCSQSQGKPEEAIQYLRSAVNHQPGRTNSLFLLTSSLVEAEYWQEAKDVLRRYEKTSRVNPQSLLMAMKIEQGLGNSAGAKGYRDMLLRIFPSHPVTKSVLSEKQASQKVVSKLVPPIKDENNSDLQKAIVPEPENTVVQVEKNDVVIISNNPDTTAEVVEEVAKEVGAVVIKPVSGMESEPESEFEPEEAAVAIVKLEPEPEIEGTTVPQTTASEFASDKTSDTAPSPVTVISPETTLVPESELEQNNQTVLEKLDKPDFHIVVKGDNLYRISLLYNIKMQRLIEWNGLADAPAILVGSKLTLVDPSVVE
ncbi:type IV pilus biogenesis/stability protein PilW [uncultured Paraglaciecola sp.]|mgnify:CR=1 FL=1|uniref:type IV pilus biogenesis/stability protein PilW n=1 Tax=uncultured Paraglaciecola sp. TaxID=1765024 RepID=UPI00262FF5FB|nr:type IV pilus biogenesis/stability protein PilW [uncultured Paraglaciecola sp.]